MLIDNHRGIAGKKKWVRNPMLEKS